MFDLPTIVTHLGQMFESRIIYVRTDKEIVDFTKLAEVSLLFQAKDKKLAIPLKYEHELSSLVNNLAMSLFTSDKTIVAWDIKPLLSYFRYHVPSVEFDLPNLFDLKLLEAFLEINKPAPITWAEALVRTAEAKKNPEAMRVHKSIHLPLTLNVVPEMETAGLLEKKKYRKLYTNYVIEGQTHGRLSTTVPTEKFVNPHNLDSQDRERFVPAKPYDLFVSFDFKNMEVVMLQWLSKDPALEKIINDPTRNVYSAIFKALTGFDDMDDETAKERGKILFLPVIYGQGAAGLASSLGVSQGAAQQVIDLMNEKFPVALKWVDEQHEKAKKDGHIVDYFGRKRRCDEHYKARHFAVAAPAATVCLEKLVTLHSSLPKDVVKTVMSVHDGYYLAVRQSDYREVAQAGKQILEQPSTLCPGLCLKTSCEVGKALSHMKKIY